MITVDKCHKITDIKKDLSSQRSKIQITYWYSWLLIMWTSQGLFGTILLPPPISMFHAILSHLYVPGHMLTSQCTRYNGNMNLLELACNEDVSVLLVFVTGVFINVFLHNTCIVVSLNSLHSVEQASKSNKKFYLFH